MVIVPVVETLLIELPDNIPMSALETTATFAGPPRRWPATARAISMNTASPPVARKKTPSNREREQIRRHDAGDEVEHPLGVHVEHLDQLASSPPAVLQHSRATRAR